MNTSADCRHSRISVVGIGNVLLGDDGFGPLAVEMFRCEYECGSNVEILDLGTPGLDLAPYLFGAELVVIADAVEAQEKPGTLCIYCEDDVAALHAPLRLTDHDPAVGETLAHLRLAGNAPSEVIIIGVVPESCGLGEGISPSVLSSSSVVVDNIARLLIERGIDCRRRHAPVRPNLWWLSGDQSELVASQGRLSTARENP